MRNGALTAVLAAAGTWRRRPGRAAGIGMFVALAAWGAAATAQVSSQQMRQRYEKSTKGANLEDFVKRLGNEDPDTRLEAVKSLGGSGDAKAVEYLIQAVGDPDVRVQAKAIVVLGDMRAADATPVLVQYLSRRSVDANLKQRILASLGKIGDERAARPIMEFLHRDLEPATRGTAIFALGEIGSAEAEQPLAELANSEDDATVRRLAEEALNKVRHQRASRLKEVKGPAKNFLAPDEPPRE